MKIDFLPQALYSFFKQYLEAQRNATPQTIRSYKDGIKQVLSFAAKQNDAHLSTLQFSDFDVSFVLNFLDYMENERNVAINTRNHSLAILRSFFRHAMTLEPEYFQQCARILNIPYKAEQQKIMDYFELDELEIYMAQPDRQTSIGRRDYLIISLMYNIGCRVDELVHITPASINFTPPNYSVTILGKGRKTRICPLWKQTIDLLNDFMAEHNIAADSNSQLFLNQRKQKLTRFGVFHMTKKYYKLAVKQMPSLTKKKIHPHSLRHTTAVHMLEAQVELNVIQHILGHSSIETTNKYAKVSTMMKRKAIEKVQNRPNTEGIWQKDENLLDWLESL